MRGPRAGLPGRGFARAAMPGIDLHVVHVVRDARGVAWSLKKGFKRQVDAYSNLVTGLKPHRYLPCDAFGFKHASFVS